MHGLKTIHQLNREATEAAAICEKHGVALGDIPAPPAELPQPTACPDCDLPNVDESAK